MPDPHTRLSRREREIVNAVFALENRASAEEIRGRLPDPPSYSAVRAMLVRLEAKGVLRHEMDGTRYIYSATTSPTAAKRAALKQYLGVFFKGSAGELVTALLRQERWTDAELERLRGEIDRIRRERQKP